MKKWTKEELESACKMAISGLKLIEIANQLGRTKQSVRNKLNKHDIRVKDLFPGKEIRQCAKCGKEFEIKKSSPKKYCSMSCSVSETNRLRKKFKQCKNCGKDISYRKIYCDNKCQGRYTRKQTFKRIEAGEYVSTDMSIVKAYLIEKRGEECEECKWNEVNEFSGKIPLEVHHKDGNSDNNNPDNVQLLCPNHHSLTKTWKGLNAGNGRFSRRNVKRRKRYSQGKSW